MQIERLIQLLAKQMGDDATEEEIRELNDMLKANPEHYYLLEILESIESEKQNGDERFLEENWRKPDLKIQALGAPETKGSKAIGTIRNVQSKRWMNKAAVSAGSLLIISGLWFMFSKQAWNKKASLSISSLQQMHVPNGAPNKKVLPDGSEVWVNSGSSIRYSDDLHGSTREVYLEGEAYFKVKHDVKHPFIVHAGNIAVRALGTEFNVQAYPDEKVIRTTLVNGRVQITMAEKPDQNIILVPNERLTVTSKELASNEKDERQANHVNYKVEQIIKTPTDSNIAELAWMNDELDFRNEKFVDLAKKMERRYNVHIKFNDPSLEDENLTGTFRNENIKKALNLLQMTTRFRYQMLGDSVFISHN